MRRIRQKRKREIPLDDLDSKIDFYMHGIRIAWAAGNMPSYHHGEFMLQRLIEQRIHRINKYTAFVAEKPKRKRKVRVK